MNVLIVDDEIVIREWLQFCIQSDSQYDVVATASNGQEALRLFRQLRPDIVITDLKMPVMDGLTLLSEIRKIDPYCIVIILTAYNEFEDVRRALRDDVSEYLLKTEISKEIIIETMNQIADRVIEKKNEEVIRVPTRVLKSVLTRKDTFDTQDLSYLKENNLQIDDEGVFAISYAKRSINSSLDFQSQDLFANLISFDYDDYNTIVVGNIIKGSNEVEKENLLIEYLKSIQLNSPVIFGLSSIRYSNLELPQIVMEAIQALSRAFYEMSNESIFKCIDQSNLHTRIEEESVYLNKMKNEIFIDNANNTMEWDELLDIFKTIQQREIMLVSEVISFCRNIVNFIYANEVSYYSSSVKEDFDLFDDLTYAVTHSFELFKATMKIVEYYVNSKKQIVVEYSNAVNLGIRFINQHYSEQISLIDVSESVHLNPEYFSRLFKKETGESFINYLTRIRLEKARQRLLTTNRKVNEIAKEVGYTNVSYFSTVFKKKYGINPYETRKNKD